MNRLQQGLDIVACSLFGLAEALVRAFDECILGFSQKLIADFGELRSERFLGLHQLLDSCLETSLAFILSGPERSKVLRGSTIGVPLLHHFIELQAEGFGHLLARRCRAAAQEPANDSSNRYGDDRETKYHRVHDPNPRNRTRTL